MNIRRALSWAVACLLLTYASVAQELRPLNIGEKMPPWELRQFLDKKTTSIRLQDLAGKLVILDFWNIYCGTCIAALPKLEKLQEQFDKQLRIIVITYNTHEEVTRQLKKLKVKTPKLLFSTGNQELYWQMFPHSGDPLHVWITPEGIIQYITEGYNATREHVQAVLEGKPPQLLERRELTDFNRQLPWLIANAPTAQRYLRSYSTLFNFGEYQPAMGKSLIIEKDTNTNEPVRISAFNNSLYDLYNVAYSKTLFGFDPGHHQVYRNNRILIETLNIYPFHTPTEPNLIDSWWRQHSFSYELYKAQPGNTDLYTMMQHDLAKHFDFSATIEQRKMKCLALVRTDTAICLQTKDVNAMPVYQHPKELLITNMPLSSSLVRSLVYSLWELSTPLINETGINYPVDLILRCELADLSALRKELRLFGMDLEEKEAIIQVLVIRDKDQKAIVKNPGEK